MRNDHWTQIRFYGMFWEQSTKSPLKPGSVTSIRDPIAKLKRSYLHLL